MSTAFASGCVTPAPPLRYALVMLLDHWTGPTCLVAAFIGPALLALFGGRVGFVVGIPAFWFTLLTAAVLLGLPYPDLWINGGWIGGLGCCTFVYFANRMTMRLRLRAKIGSMTRHT